MGFMNYVKKAASTAVLAGALLAAGCQSNKPMQPDSSNRVVDFESLPSKEQERIRNAETIVDDMSHRNWDRDINGIATRKVFQTGNPFERMEIVANLLSSINPDKNVELGLELFDELDSVGKTKVTTEYLIDDGNADPFDDKNLAKNLYFRLDDKGRRNVTLSGILVGETSAVDWYGGRESFVSSVGGYEQLDGIAARFVRARKDPSNLTNWIREGRVKDLRDQYGVRTNEELEARLAESVERRESAAQVMSDEDRVREREDLRSRYASGEGQDEILEAKIKSSIERREAARLETGDEELARRDALIKEAKERIKKRKEERERLRSEAFKPKPKVDTYEPSPTKEELDKAREGFEELSTPVSTEDPIEEFRKLSTPVKSASEVMWEIARKTKEEERPSFEDLSSGNYRKKEDENLETKAVLDERDDSKEKDLTDITNKNAYILEIESDLDSWISDIETYVNENVDGDHSNKIQTYRMIKDKGISYLVENTEDGNDLPNIEAVKGAENILDDINQIMRTNFPSLKGDNKEYMELRRQGLKIIRGIDPNSPFNKDKKRGRKEDDESGHIDGGDSGEVDYTLRERRQEFIQDRARERLNDRLAYVKIKREQRRSDAFAELDSMYLA